MSEPSKELLPSEEHKAVVPSRAFMPGTRTAEQSEKLLTVVHALSELVNTGLSRESLKICTELLRAGVDAKSLTKVIKAIRSEMKASTGPAGATASEVSQVRSSPGCVNKKAVKKPHAKDDYA